jgi:hypothetical protein
VRELDPIDVLADLLDSADFPAEVPDPVEAAKIILDRLRDAGFDAAEARTRGDDDPRLLLAAGG